MGGGGPKVEKCAGWISPRVFKATLCFRHRHIRLCIAFFPRHPWTLNANQTERALFGLPWQDGLPFENVVAYHQSCRCTAIGAKNTKRTPFSWVEENTLLFGLQRRNGKCFRTICTHTLEWKTLTLTFVANGAKLGQFNKKKVPPLSNGHCLYATRRGGWSLDKGWDPGRKTIGHRWC